jgi:ring-1,2-phenylacetyl-CoA epoxidase subunit PaaC
MTGDRQSDLKSALSTYLLAMADDELILAHRDSQWTGHAPILEEDIAFSNIAQDEMGHASIWYGLLQDFSGQDPDRLVFFRDAVNYRNVQMVEMPNHDWAFSMLRQYLFDAFERIRLSHLQHSSYQPLAEAAIKIHVEELYHFRHTSNWVKRLGLGTEESNRRMQEALDTLWGFTGQLFEPSENDSFLLQADYIPDSEVCRLEWQGTVVPFLKSVGLRVPVEAIPNTDPRTIHTSHLEGSLSDMQEVARKYPDAQW